ncbi:MAG TPA: glycosyltransferase family 4 protein [Candidatus Saccharimonadia bacterium]|nr:glycosyltransferase family 4 protein [Candidatus Saccharimonadia bacterium]
MKIAMMVRGYIPVPCPADIIYAPIDLAVQISEGLAAQGHEVTFYAPTGSRLSVPTETLKLRPLVHNLKEHRELLNDAGRMSHDLPGLWDQYMARDMFERAKAGEFDLLHFHHPEMALPYARLYPEVPVVYTFHDPFAAWYREALEMYVTPSQFYISISQNQRVDAPDLPYIANIYNGIDTEQFAFSEEHDGYLLFAGRIVPEKGVKEAIQVAQQANQRLLIIGPTYPDQQEYFDAHIKPHLNERILYLGFLEREHLIKYYQMAKALLFPIQWEEPFGLTMTEAMACGTPVIALRRGSVAEVVKHNKTGFVVDSLAEMAAAVQKIDTIKRQDCRDHVVKNFSIEKMVRGYAAAFEAALRATNTPAKPSAKKAVSSQGIGAGTHLSG